MDLSGNISALFIQREAWYKQWMRDNQNPLFRKIIAPWYDSEFACALVIIFMVLVICFGGLGLSVALEHPAYRGLAGIPFLLIFLGLYVLISSAIRLFRRKRSR